MKPKPLAIAVGILALLSLLAWYLQRPPALPPPDPRVGHPVLANQVLSRADAIRLTDGSKTVLLKKRADGKWIDASYFDLPADFSKLSQFTGDLNSAKIERLVTRRPDVLARLDFKNTGVTLLKNGKTLWQLTLGKDSDSGGQFVKFGDEKKGYLANTATYLDSTAKNWADSLLVNLKPQDVASVDVEFKPGETITVSRPKKGAPWVSAQTPAGKQVKSETVTYLLSSLTSLRFKDTTGLKAAAVKTARKYIRTVKLVTFDHQTVTVALGRKPAEKVPEIIKPVTKKVTVSGKTTSKAGSKAKATPAKPKEKTIPAGPVFAFVHSSDSSATVNALMEKRAFEVYDWNYTSLPKKPADLFEPVPTPPKAAAKTGGTKGKTKQATAGTSGPRAGAKSASAKSVGTESASKAPTTTAAKSAASPAKS